MSEHQRGDVFGPTGIAGGPLTEVRALEPVLDELADPPSSAVLGLRRHVKQRWPIWACRDAIEACGGDLVWCERWLAAHRASQERKNESVESEPLTDSAHAAAYAITGYRDARAFVGEL